MKYAIVIEPTRTGYSAYVPDLPGCVAAAGSYETAEKLITRQSSSTLRPCARTAVRFPNRGRRSDQWRFRFRNRRPAAPLHDRIHVHMKPVPGIRAVQRPCQIHPQQPVQDCDPDSNAG